MLPIILCIALALVVLSVDFSWNNLVSAKRNEMVFENRNKSYGAYVHRKENHKNLFIAMLVTFALALGAAYAAIAGTEVETVIKHIEIPVTILPSPPSVQTKAIEKKVLPEEKPAKPSKPTLGSTTPDIDNTVTPSSTLPERGGNPDGEETPDLQTPVDPNSKDNGSGTQIVTPPAPKIETWAQIMPAFPGGDQALYEFLYSRIHYTPKTIEYGTEGTIYVQFVVDTQGAISEFKIVRTIDHAEDLEKQIMKAFDQMPLWSPGKNGNKIVPVRHSIPIVFHLH
ncbi:MAG: energy transducer TonB [Flavobacteriales bacterium]|jgi:protein TonB